MHKANYQNMWGVGEAKDSNEEPATLESKEKEELKAPGEKLPNKTHNHDYGNGLLKNDSRFIKKILDTMVNPVSYKDRNGVYREVNQAYVTRVAGIPREEIIGKTLLEVSNKISDKLSGKIAIQERSLQVICIEWAQQDTEVMKTGETITDEQELILADGKKRTFIVNKSPLRDENGEIIGIVTLIQDITELSRTEKALKESLSLKEKLNEQLKENEERYRLVTEKAGQIVYDYDIETDSTTWTGAVKKLTGYSPDSLQNSSEVFWRNHLHPEDRKKALETYHEHLEKGEDFRMEYRFRKKDGSYIYRQCSEFAVNCKSSFCKQ